MNSEMLAKQIETYSNAIVAFAVLQGLAYAYAFGTNDRFNCVVRTEAYLAELLSALFVIVTTLSAVAILALGRTLKRIAGEFRPVVAKIYVAKVIAVILFSALPLTLTVAYGVRDYPDKASCKNAAKRA